MPRSALRSVLVVTVVAGATLVHAAPAHAVPDIPCTQANVGAVEIGIESADIHPTLTHFMAINIAPGTTGQRTETLTVMNEVTVTVGASTEITGEGSIALVKVSVKVGFSVQYSRASTRTESTQMVWTFNEPGYYALYKGTRAVSGSYQKYACRVKSASSTVGFWFPVPPLFGVSYSTFDHVEAGTIRCGDSTPPGSLREQARLQLGC